MWENSLGWPTKNIPRTNPPANAGAPRANLAAFPNWTPATLCKEIYVYVESAPKYTADHPPAALKSLPPMIEEPKVFLLLLTLLVDTNS